MLWKLECLYADVTLVALPEGVSLFVVGSHRVFGHHRVAVGAFGHVTGAVKGVSPIVAHRDVLLTAIKQIDDVLS